MQERAQKESLFNISDVDVDFQSFISKRFIRQD